MNSLVTIIKKELADHFSSYRFTIIFALIAMVSLITAYMVGLNIRKELEGVTKPHFIFNYFPQYCHIGSSGLGGVDILLLFCIHRRQHFGQCTDIGASGSQCR